MLYFTEEKVALYLYLLLFISLVLLGPEPVNSVNVDLWVEEQTPTSIRYHTFSDIHYEQDQFFKVATTFQKYSEFMPIFHKFTMQDNANIQNFLAHVKIRYAYLFNTSYDVKVQTLAPFLITMEGTEESLKKSLIKRMRQYWRLREKIYDEKKGVEVEFFLEFELWNPLLNGLAQSYFQKIMEQSLESFEKQIPTLCEEIKSIEPF